MQYASITTKTSSPLAEVYLTGIPFSSFPLLPQSVRQLQIDCVPGIFPESPPEFLLNPDKFAGFIIYNDAHDNTEASAPKEIVIRNVQEYTDVINKYPSLRTPRASAVPPVGKISTGLDACN